jgi:hypothetical protein
VGKSKQAQTWRNWSPLHPVSEWKEKPGAPSDSSSELLPVTWGRKLVFCGFS